MKKTITILIAFILSISIYAQNTPEKFTYQAVVRNADNTLAANKQVGIRISILKTSSSGAVAYEETQTPTTNANGLLTIKIGDGTVISGTAISSIDWGADKYYIKTEISLQNNGTYDISSTPTQLLSVPYALHAKTADNATTYTSGNGIDITGNAIAVKPATTNSGLTATTDGLKVKADANKGLTVDATDGLQVNAGDGLTSNSTDGLKVKLAATDPGLAFDSNGGLKANSVAYTADTDGSIIVANSKIKVNAGDGLTSNSTDGLKVKLAATNPGLSVDATGLKVKADANKGLTVDATDGLQVKAGDGLTSNSTDGLKVKLAATNPGLSVDATGLKVKADANKGLTVDATDGLQVNAGDGLTSNSTDGLKVKLAATNPGLSVDATGLKVKADANKGLTVDATDGLQVKAGDGLTSNSTDGLKVKLAATNPGLSVDATGLKVKADANKGLTVDATDGLQVKAGDGLTTTVDGLKVKLAATNPGLSVDATGLKVKADANKGLTVDATDGLQVKAGDGLTTTVDGLKVKLAATNPGLSVDATGLKVKADANKGLTVDATNGLQVKADVNKGLTVDATNGLQVKADANKGLIINASNGLQVKTGSGIAIDGTGAITTEPIYHLGDHVLGGYVFYVTDGGKHGLVVASQNTIGPKITYSAFVESLTNPTTFDVEGRRYTDWRIPTKYEMKNIYNISRCRNNTTKVDIGSFSSSGYWTSSESDTDALKRYRVDLKDNEGTVVLAGIAAKYKYYARPIRSF